MKNIVILLLVVAGAFVAYNYFIDVEPASAEERELIELERSFQSARQSFTQATRSAGLAGLDVTADIEAAVASTKRIEAELDRLIDRLASESNRKRARKLQQRIKNFKNRLG